MTYPPFAIFPSDMKDAGRIAPHHELIDEKICELDDDLMMAYLEGEEPSSRGVEEQLCVTATCQCAAIPVCCGSCLP